MELSIFGISAVFIGVGLIELILVICSFAAWATDNRESWCSFWTLVLAACFVPSQYITWEVVQWVVPTYFIIGFLWSLVKYSSKIRSYIKCHPETGRDRVEQLFHVSNHSNEISLWILPWPISIIVNALGRLPRVVMEIVKNHLIYWYKWVLASCLNSAYDKQK